MFLGTWFYRTAKGVFDMPTVNLPQGLVNYQVAGPADSALPPVVFVHGIMVNGELWAGTATALAEHGIRSYAPDLPLGAHQTAMNPDADLSPRGVATLILSFLETLGLTDVTLVANDTGSALCQFLIDTDASRIGRLILTNGDALDKFPPPQIALMVKVASNPSRLRMMMLPMNRTAVRHSFLGYGPLARRLDAAQTARWVAPLRSDAGVRRDSARFMRGMRRSDLLDVSTRLSTFTRPVLLVWGASDRLFPLAFARKLAAVFPDARLVEVEGGRTFLPLDEPGRVASEISGFLAPVQPQ
jgi:pimeloyl-ACP methyl ester carboxylesterase